MEVKRITPEQAKELLDSNQDYIYLDVRTVGMTEFLFLAAGVQPAYAVAMAATTRSSAP